MGPRQGRRWGGAEAGCAGGGLVSRVQLSVTTWTVAHQAPLSMGFSRQECWNGLPFPSPGDLPDPGIEPASPMSPAFAAEFFTLVPPDKIGSSYTDLSSLEVPIYTV